VAKIVKKTEMPKPALTSGERLKEVVQIKEKNHEHGADQQCSAGISNLVDEAVHIEDVNCGSRVPSLPTVVLVKQKVFSKSPAICLQVISFHHH